MSDPNRTQALNNDPNRTRMGSPISTDPNRTIMGGAPSLNATMTIKPVQCPVCKTYNPVGVMFCVDCGLIFDRALPEDAFGAPAIQLPCIVDQSGREHTIMPGMNVLGRQGDIALDDSRISRRHAQITSENGKMVIEDLGSTNGTSVNGEELQVGVLKEVVSGDKISLGGCEFVLSMPGESAKTAMGLSGKTAALSTSPTTNQAIAYLVSATDRYPLKSGENTFGRRSENSVIISDPYVSGRHGVIEITDDGVFLTDTGSTNGTLLNDARINPNQRLSIGPDDVIKLGKLELKIERE